MPNINQPDNNQGNNPMAAAVTMFSTVLDKMPNTAIPIVYYKPDKNSTPEYCVLAIDSTNKFVYMGSSTLLQGCTSGDYLSFFDNLMSLIVATADYGSCFTDMLIDGSSVPAPWDSVWGANAYPN
jgi:hypothetical protein